MNWSIVKAWSFMEIYFIYYSFNINIIESYIPSSGLSEFYTNNLDGYLTLPNLYSISIYLLHLSLNVLKLFLNIFIKKYFETCKMNNTMILSWRISFQKQDIIENKVFLTIYCLLSNWNVYQLFETNSPSISPKN